MTKSCTFVMRPMRISWHSARSTALCQTDASAPIVTAPKSCADGAIHADGSITGVEDTAPARLLVELDDRDRAGRRGLHAQIAERALVEVGLDDLGPARRILLEDVDRTDL